MTKGFTNLTIKVALLEKLRLIAAKNHRTPQAQIAFWTDCKTRSVMSHAPAGWSMLPAKVRKAHLKKAIK